MKKIFNEFESTSFADWMQKIESDLKGKPIDSLTSHPEPDLEIVAYHHKDNQDDLLDNGTARNLSRPTNNWRVRKVFDDNAGNAAILEALNNGVDALGFKVDENTAFEKLTKAVLFEHIQTDIAFNEKKVALGFNPPKSATLNFDVIERNASSGNDTLSLEDFYAFYQKFDTQKTIWVSGANYGKAGASTIQELAFTIAHLNEYLQYLTDQGESLATINEKITIELSVNENYFVNIAKFRAIHDLVALLFKGYNENYSVIPVDIYAVTNTRHLAQNDKNNNPLRQTTQAMSAVVGGCNVLTVEYGKVGTDQEVERFERIAKNIQLVLKEEAYLGKVVDPAGGSYYIESLTKQLLEKSWDLFLQTEKNGGLMTSLAQNLIQEKINENKAILISNMLNNKRTFLGVNKHPNNMEEWQDTKREVVEEGSAYEPLKPFLLENHFSKTVADHE